jgi:hypothetical protein
MEIELELKLAGREIELKAKGWRAVVQCVGIGLIAASIVRELSLPPNERTWHGTLFGKVPYDLRPPDPRRIAARLWDPENPRVLVPTAFGVGWTLNLAALRPVPSRNKCAWSGRPTGGGYPHRP